MELSELLQGDMAQQVVNGISKHAGTSAKDTHSVINEALPVLTGMLHKNASSEDGAKSLQNALQKHDGSVLDNIDGFLGMDDDSDGNGILSHILGSDQSNVAGAISKKTGVSSSAVQNILAKLAPVLMGTLGKKANSGATNSVGGLSDILGGMLGSNGGGSDILSSLLKGGNPLESILGGGGKKGGFLGGLLGGLFGKK